MRLNLSTALVLKQLVLYCLMTKINESRLADLNFRQLLISQLYHNYMSLYGIRLLPEIQLHLHKVKTFITKTQLQVEKQVQLTIL